MKRLILIPLILILTACASGKNAGVTPPSNVMSAEPSVVKTLVPENTKTPVPPTPTVDPMANAPDGATGVSPDGKSFYKDVVDAATSGPVIDPHTGEQLVETWTEFKDKEGKVLWSGWTVEKTPTGGEVPGLPLLDLDKWSAIPLRVFVADGYQGIELFPTITHQDDTDKNSDGQQFQSPFLGQLNIRKFGEQVSVTQAERNKFLQSLYSNEGVSFEYNTSFGENTSAVLGHYSGFKLIVMSFDNPFLDKSKIPEVSEQVDMYGMTVRTLSIGSDKDGNAVFLMATEKSFDSYPRVEQKKALLFNVGNFIQQVDQKESMFFRIIGVMAEESESPDPVPYIMLDGK